MTEIRLIRGDITKIEVDCIVNAANSSLLGGGGVDGAIHRAGGPSILEECRAIRARQGGCPTGEAVITGAGNLPAKFVIHTVGPVWSGHDQEQKDELLKSCYLSSLHLAKEHPIQSIAFPNISTGIYNFPKSRAASIAVDTINSFIQENNFLEIILFVCFDPENYDLYQERITQL